VPEPGLGESGDEECRASRSGVPRPGSGQAARRSPEYLESAERSRLTRRRSCARPGRDVCRRPPRLCSVPHRNYLKVRLGLRILAWKSSSGIAGGDSKPKKIPRESFRGRCRRRALLGRVTARPERSGFPGGKRSRGGEQRRERGAVCHPQPGAVFRGRGRSSASCRSAGGREGFFMCKRRGRSGGLPNEIQTSGGWHGHGGRSSEAERRLAVALQLQPLHAGAGVALVAADALQAPALVQVARAAAPVEVRGEVVRALHVHVHLLCREHGIVKVGKDHEVQPSTQPHPAC